VILPVWLDLARRSGDRDVLKIDFESVQATPVPRASPPAAAQGAATSGPRRADGSPMPNVQCRSYVYGRCNALRIGPRECLEIATDAVEVPIDDGDEGCREVTEPLLKDMVQRLGQEFVPPRGFPATDDDSDQPAGGVVGGGNELEAGAPVGREAPSTEPAALERQEPIEAAPPPDGPPPLSDAERARAMERMMVLVDELQRGGHNYATSVAIQEQRLAELRSLAEAEGSEKARELFNRLHDLYAARAPAALTMDAPESPRIEAAPAQGDSPATTAELEDVRSLVDDARRQAGLPPAPQAESPTESMRPTATVTSEVPTSTVGSESPAATVNSESIRAENW
jgi:hypothetical protein